MTVRFGVFEMDAAAGELRRSGRLVRLQQQPFKVLVELVRRPGEVVTRDELRLVLWAEGTHVEFERGLNFAVSRVRDALGDSARAPRFVETVQRRGYRFVAPVEVVGPAVVRAPVVVPADVEPALPPPSVSSPSTTPLLRPRPVPRAALGLAASCLILVLALSAGVARSRRVPRLDPVASHLYDEARQLCGSEGWRKSIRLYREVLSREPTFADAAVGIARSYVSLAEHGWLDAEQAFPPAREAAVAALTHGESWEARLLLGTVLLEYDWSWEAAERELSRAVALAPSSAVAWSRLARLRSLRGEDARAVDAARHAESLDPGDDAVVVELAECLYRAGRLDEAARAWRMVSSENAVRSHHALFTIHRRLGRDAEAVTEAGEVMMAVGVPAPLVESVLRDSPVSGARSYLYGTIAALARRADRERVAPDRLAVLHAALGERERALACLEQAVTVRSPSLLQALRDPLLHDLRNEPRFQALLRQVGLGVPGELRPESST